MLRLNRSRLWASGLLFAAASTGASASAAEPTVEQALKLVPIQKNVNYDQPHLNEIPKCTIKPEKGEKLSGWAVFGPAGEPLRRFVDTNGDGQIDLWCYYNDGLEVYRDIDSDYNLKADQYRWFNTAGTRWGIDAKEDRTIDAWKTISAEEVSREIVTALAAGDEKRFAALLLTAEELESLGLGKARHDEVASHVSKAPDAFAAMIKSQK